jgi:hypothetical protein
MNVKSLEEAKNIAYKSIRMDLSHPNRAIIIDELTLEFEWGYVFYYNGKKFLENRKDHSNAFLGNLPILVDKNDGTAHCAHAIWETLDTKLEEYRILKGYPHVIKFPIKTTLRDKTLLEQVRLLFRTQEIYQIKQGLEIAQQNNLFDIDQLKNIVWRSDDVFERTFEECIAFIFGRDTIYLEGRHIINENFTSELKIFDDFKNLQISEVKLLCLPDDILKFPDVECIEFWDTEIDDITPQIFKLNKLTTIKFSGVSKLPIFGNKAKEVLEKLKTEKNVRIVE